MAVQRPIPYSTLSDKELIDQHNELAKERGLVPLRRWRDSRCRLVERIAILRTRTPVTAPTVPPKRPRKKRPSPIREICIEALTHVAHRIDGKTVGLNYAECLARVKERAPTSKTTEGTFRWMATQIRNQMPGFEGVTLPDIRPQRPTRRRDRAP